MDYSAHPETVTALTAASDQYEDALARNDISALDALFSPDERATRLGATENLFGPEDIARFRRHRAGGAPPRQRLRREIIALGPDAGCVIILFLNLKTGQTGRQSQTWVREHGIWRILVAHVSFLNC